MINNFVIGVGGTGAKCVEALTHLSAAGIGPGSLFIILVDPDKANGNVKRTREAFRKYVDCREVLGLGQKDLFFKTSITCADDNPDNLLWSPAATTNLRSYFKYSLLSTEAKMLCDLLYTQEEIDQPLDWGFRGHPSIGAPLMAQVEARGGESPWFQFHQLINECNRRGEQARVFVFGSIFGGTGAAAFPTIGGILGKRYSGQPSFGLGGCLLLPYFTYPVPPEAVAGKDLYADPANFLLNTKAALRFYHDMQSLGEQTYKRIYFLGERTSVTFEDFKPGSEGQKNPGHYIEALAAMAAIDWFKTDFKTDDKINPFSFLGADEDVLYWSDLPGGDLAEKQLVVFTTFMKSYEEFYSPLIDRRAGLEAHRERLPWYVDHFKEGELNTADARDQKVRLDDYLNNSFKEWFINTFELSYKPDRHLKLLSLTQELNKIKY